MDRPAPFLYALAVLFVSGFLFFTEATHQVRLETTMGTIVVELDSSKAPITVANFMHYVRSSYYNGTIIHRVIEDFVIQGGGLTADMKEKPTTKPPIKNEAYNGLKNLYGTIAMARTSDPHSATSQFYINTKDNPGLNFKDSTANGWGYCVFGKVIGGMSVVDSIDRVPTMSKNGHKDVPVNTITITKAVEVQTGINTNVKILPRPYVTFLKNNNSITAILQTQRSGCFEIFNAKGRTIFSYNDVKPGQTIIPIDHLSSGVYVYTVKSGAKRIASGSMVKQ